MGKFWVQKSAVGPKWSNYQPFGFKFGLYSLLLGISTWKTENFLISFCKWGNFGSQKVRSVLNRAIVNHFASNLDCAHDFKISPPAKEERPPNYFFLGHFFFFDKIFSSFFSIFFSTFNDISQVIQVL